MDSWDLLLDLLLLLATSFLLGGLGERLGIGALPGYLVAGATLGPNALHLVASSSEVATFAELGVAVLLFSIGLEFSWRRLRTFGSRVLWAGLVQIGATLALTGTLLMLTGTDGATAWALGAVLTMSSTATVLPMLVKRNELDSEHGRAALGILLVQDIAILPMLLVLESSVAGATGETGVGGRLLQALLACAVLSAGFAVAFLVVLPRILTARWLRGNRELVTLLAILCSLGSAAVAHKAGVSPGLGAFLAGMMIAASPFAVQIRADLASLKTVLLILFFGSVGMLLDPAWALQNAATVLLGLALLVPGKGVIIWAGLRGLRWPNAAALAAGLALAQVGELGIVLAEVARGTLLSRDQFQLVCSLVALTLLLTPLFVQRAGTLARGRRAGPGPGERDPGARTAGFAEGPSRVLLIGYGPAGREVARALAAHGTSCVVLDLNPDNLVEARDAGFDTMLGDATRPELLSEVHGPVSGVVLTLPDPATCEQIVRLAREIYGDVPILARARYERMRAALLAAGASHAASEEVLVGRDLARSLAEELEKRAEP